MPDVSKPLAAIVGRLTDQRDRDGRPRSWWRWAVVAVLIVVGLLVGLWVLSKDRRELARLRHEKYKAQVEADNARVDKQVAAAERDVKHAQIRIATSRAAIERVDDALAHARRRYATDESLVNRLRFRDLRRADPDRR